MFKLADGREHLCQWDCKIKLLIDEPTDCKIDEVHFCSRHSYRPFRKKPVRTDEECYVIIPDALLITDYDIEVYAYCNNENGTYTKHSDTFSVLPRLKPDNYVHTPQETRLFYQKLDKPTEGNGIAGQILATNGDGSTKWIDDVGGTGTSGLNAYEIAVKCGFQGTEKEWIESLKGADGKDGKDYILTDNDKTDIANLVIDMLPDGDEVSY